MNVRRYHPRGVVPLELWDVAIDGTPLYLVPEPAQPAAIAQLVGLLARGRAWRVRTATALPALAVESVVVAGGGPVEHVVAALRSAGFSAESARCPVWVAEPGAQAILAQEGFPTRGAVLDIGQTSLKYSDDAGRLRTWRDLGLLPLECDVPEAALASYREDTVQFFAGALRCHAQPHALVLALPCEISDDLRVLGCSYPWRADDPTLVHDVLQRAGWESVATFVLNDAELAATSVSLLRAVQRPSLVLTIGRGLGGAYLPAAQLREERGENAERTPRA